MKKVIRNWHQTIDEMYSEVPDHCDFEIWFDKYGRKKIEITIDRGLKCILIRSVPNELIVKPDMANRILVKMEKG